MLSDSIQTVCRMVGMMGVIADAHSDAMACGAGAMAGNVYTCSLAV